MGLEFAFTITYNGIADRLISSATIIYNGVEYKTNLAQWDTGASNTFISKNVVSALNLSSSEPVQINSPSGACIANAYKLDIKLHNESICIQDICVADSEIADQGIDLLIGMDIIKYGDFSVSNVDGNTVFSFRVPSARRIDYVKEITDAQNNMG